VLTVPLRSKRRERALLAQKIQHVVAGVMLLVAGLQALGEEHHGFPFALALFEIVSSALLIGSAVFAFKKARRPVDHEHLPHLHHGGVDWMDIFAAGVLFAEVAEHWHLKHHIQRPAVLTAVTVLVLGLFHGRIARRAERRFTIRVGDDDLYVGGKPFRTLRSRWADLLSIDIGPRYATIKTRAGRERRLDLTDLEGATHVRAALAEAGRRLAGPTPSSLPAESVPPPVPSP
jgi:hypothetical protein